MVISVFGAQYSIAGKPHNAVHSEEHFMCKPCLCSCLQVWACSHPPQLTTRMYTCDHVLTLLKVFPYPIHIVAHWLGILPQVSRGQMSRAYLEFISKFASLAHWLHFLKSVPQRSYAQACLILSYTLKRHFMELGESSSPVQ